MSETPPPSSSNNQEHYAPSVSGDLDAKRNSIYHSNVGDYDSGLGELSNGFSGFQPDFPFGHKNNDESSGLAADLTNNHPSQQLPSHSEKMDSEQNQYDTLPRASYELLPVPPVARTPPDSGSKLSQKSPTSFSSKSLGLDSLDFGYDKKVVDNLLPPSPGNSPPVSSLPSSRSNTNSSNTSQAKQTSFVLSPHTQPEALAQHASSYDVSLHKELSVATGLCINSDSIMIPFEAADDHMSVIDLVDISILDEADNASEIAAPVDSPSTAAISNDNTDNMLLVFCDDGSGYKDESEYAASAALHYRGRLCSDKFPKNTATSIAHFFGTVETIPEEESETSLFSAPVSDVDDQEDYSSSRLNGIASKSVNSQSPYAVRDIDELLVELGVAETTLISDTTKDSAQNRESFCSKIPYTSRPFSSDPDAFSLKEIDELIEQLETDRPAAPSLDRGNAVTSDEDASTFTKSITDIIRRHGNIISLTELVPLPEPLPTHLDVSATILELGAVIVPATESLSPLALLDVSGLVSGLGAVIVPDFSSTLINADPPTKQPLDIASLICQLGRSEVVALAAERKDQLALDVPGLIIELGAVLAPYIPLEASQAEKELEQSMLRSEPLDVDSLIRSLGSPEMVIPAVLHTSCRATPRCLDIPDIIAGLGGVYVPTFSASVIDEATEVDIQALFTRAISSSEVSQYKTGMASSVLTTTTTTSSSSYCNTWTLSSLPDMDVDEIVSGVETSRSRASSIATTVSENPRQLRQRIVDSIHSHNDGISISRLICALNIAPIFVRRPLLGPSRVVVFPRFY
ncbi:hypothetical protein EV178_006308 [Coemansia sp. RSA 1646]|nr:hypothetical protein EV178_006308 [Coemansia sp. RSA 1646]